MSVVPWSTVANGTSTRRMDPEYFKKQYLEDDRVFARRAADFQTFEELGISVDGSAFYPAIEEYYGTGHLPFIRVGDVDAVIDFEGCLRIPAELCARFPTLLRVNVGDIVLTKGGSVARIGLVTEEAAASRDLIIVRSSRLSEAEQALLYLYSQSRLFQRALVRSSSQTAQPHLTITLVRQLPILRASRRLADECLRIVRLANQMRDRVKARIADAETLVTQALGLSDWEAPSQLSYTATAAQVFSAQRMDAEYFNPAKKAVLARLSELPGDPLDTHYAAVRDMFDPANATAVDVVRNFDLSDALHFELGDGHPVTPAIEVGSAKKRFAHGDVVISRLRSYLREIALVRTSPSVPTVGSSEFIVLRQLPGRDGRTLAPAALLVFLRSLAVQTILRWSQDGSHHPRFSEDDLLPTPVPQVICDLSAEIEDLFELALADRRHVRNLFDLGVNAVETAIEGQEEAAIAALRER